ncbi:MAG: efflux RND transporter periplasmic adaptor subunit, partial [Alphaproteobacteria bacterium]
QASAPAGIPVTVGVAAAQDMPIYARGIGTVQAYKMVTVKSRVDGQIVKVSFDEGQEVKAGDPLFQIDPRPFQASLDQAMANKQRDEAQLAGAAADLERYGKLIGQGYQSRQSYDQQKATVDSLKGSLAADAAAIETAKLNLGFADIRAPIDGRTGSRQVDPGNLIQAGQNKADLRQLHGAARPYRRDPHQPEVWRPDRRGLRQRRQDRARPRQRHPDREPDRLGDRHAQAQGDLRQYPRTAVARRVRQRPADPVHAQGRGDGAPAYRDAGRQRLLRLCREGRQHGRAAHRSGRGHAGWRRGDREGPGARRKGRDRRPVPPDQRRPHQGRHGQARPTAGDAQRAADRAQQGLSR